MRDSCSPKLVPKSFLRRIIAFKDVINCAGGLSNVSSLKLIRTCMEHQGRVNNRRKSSDPPSSPYLDLDTLLSCLSVCFISSSQVSVRAYCRRSVVVLHTHHHLLLHSQPGCLPHRGEDGFADRKCRGPGQADRDRLWDVRLRLY